MTWETRLFDLFDDLEQQAEGLSLASRDAEVADLGRAEYAAVDLVSRLHASLGSTISLDTAAGHLRGRLARVGAGWGLVVTEVGEAVFSLAAVRRVRGLDARSYPEQVRPVVTKVGLGSALRALAEEGVPAAVADVSGTVYRGRIARVGADFLELDDLEGGGGVIPFAAVATVRRR